MLVSSISGSSEEHKKHSRRASTGRRSKSFGNAEYGRVEMVSVSEESGGSDGKNAVYAIGGDSTGM